MTVLDQDLMALMELGQGDNSVGIHLTERDLSLVLGLMKGRLKGWIRRLALEQD